jgi:hypothetical protein
MYYEKKKLKILNFKIINFIISTKKRNLECSTFKYNHLESGFYYKFYLYFLAYLGNEIFASGSHDESIKIWVVNDQNSRHTIRSLVL